MMMPTTAGATTWPHAPFSIPARATVAISNPKPRALDEQWIDQIVALQMVAGDGQIVPRDRDWLKALFDRGDKIIGIVNDDGRLVAQAVLRQNIDTPLPGITHKFNGAASQSCISCVLVHPGYRGQRLMGHLLESCLEIAGRNGQRDIHARVRIGNDSSLKNFLRRGFQTIAYGPSPENPDKIVHFLHMGLK